MTELACRDIVFHFNKAHLTDAKIPMWVIKTRGQTFYVNHVTCAMPWSTKESPHNSHTKGAIKIKHALLTIDDQNEAVIHPLTQEDQQRLSSQSDLIRIGWTWDQKDLMAQLFEDLEIAHSEIRWLSSGCTTGYYVCDIYDADQLMQLKLIMEKGFRQFASNEWQYKDYDLNESHD